MNLEKASDKVAMKTCGIIYAPPGTGKTTCIPFLAKKGGKTLLIDIDRSSQVLRSDEIKAAVPGIEPLLADVDILQIGFDMSKWVEAVKWLEDGAYKGYQVIVVDNLSELEHQMLTEYGRIGKNDGAPEQLHYNRTQFKVIDYVRRLRALDTNIMFTCWETQQEIIYQDGSKYTQAVPRLSGKSVDTVAGLCNVVARLKIGKESRYFGLEKTPTEYAKDQLRSRKYCAINELI